MLCASPFFFLSLVTTAFAQTAPDELQQAQALANSGNFKQSEPIARHYLQTNPQSAECHYLLAYVLFRENQPRPSLAEYTEAANYRTPTAADLEAVASDYVLLEDYADADKWYSKALEWNPKDALGWYYLGRTKYHENQFSEAIHALEKCLELDPRNVKAEDNIGLSYDGLGLVEKAIAAYQIAIAWQSASPKKIAGPYLNLGILLVNNNREKEAISYLEQAETIAPDDAQVQGAIGKAFLHLNQLDKAQSALENAAKLAPDDAAPHYVLAQLYRKQGKNEKASEENRRYADLRAKEKNSK